MGEAQRGLEWKTGEMGEAQRGSTLPPTSRFNHQGAIACDLKPSLPDLISPKNYLIYALD